MSLWLSGIGVSRGIAIGRVQVVRGAQSAILEYAIEALAIEAEIERFRAAVAAARAELESIRARVPVGTPSEISAFIDTHLLMIEDRAIVEATVGHIRSLQCNAESALRRAHGALAATFDQIEDPYLRSRRDDVDQVCERLMRGLQQCVAMEPGASGAVLEPFVAVAVDLSPADLILLAQQGLAAIVTESGGPLSHSAILARSLGVPALAGVKDASRLFREGDMAVVDGAAGFALIEPNTHALGVFAEAQARERHEQEHLILIRDQPARTRDGVPIRLLANIDLPEDIAQALAQRADGVGLYRTEFLYMNRPDLPSEDEQYEAYCRVLKAMDGPVTVRTADIGSDKLVAWQRGLAPPANPALGLRAIRLSLRDIPMFRTQLRALLRASVHGQLRIMLPMVTTLTEVHRARALMQQCLQELSAEGHAIRSRVALGAMIEVPAAAVIAEKLASVCDFFSIGTNDLIQYTLAIDRVDEQVNYLYDPLHPAVLALIAMTIHAARVSGIPVSLCGEMAGDPRYADVLMGLGLREFSMHPAHLLEVKRAVLSCGLSQAEHHAAGLVGAGH
jgi:phosphotransferase system enzyme I (PtsI)